MTRASPAFTQAKVRRAVAGAIQGGAHVSKVEIDPDGKITLFCGEPPATEEAPEDLSVFAARLEEIRKNWRRRPAKRGSA